MILDSLKGIITYTGFKMSLELFSIRQEVSSCSVVRRVIGLSWSAVYRLGVSLFLTNI